MSNLNQPLSVSRLRVTFALVAVFAFCAFAATPNATAQTYSVLYNFGAVANDGDLPEGKLAVDSNGNLYGTTNAGGTGTFTFGTAGTIFKIDSAGNETILHNFVGTDGASPTGGVIRDPNGNLYGTTQRGGDLTQCSNAGCGTIFQLDPSGTLTTLHIFESGTDGALPTGSLISVDGELYGVTEQGGSGQNRGTIFKVSKNGLYHIIYRFSGGIVGQDPKGITADSAGNLYGVAYLGGDEAGNGLIFKLDATNHLTDVFLFPGGRDGSRPVGRILLDANGNFHGMTQDGGDLGCRDSLLGCGVVYRVSNTGVQSVLHRFGKTGVTDGEFPVSSLVDAGGVLYGATADGGNLCGNSGCGTLFRIGKDGTYTQLHDFPAFTGDAITPGELTLDSAGNLYGVSESGGQFGSGTVFKVTP
jgi:uncharacterized repeat protein (TIGR03803 family)